MFYTAFKLENKKIKKDVAISKGTNKKVSARKV